MSWAMVGGAAVGVVGNALTSDKNGGAGTTAASKEPWAPAAPWLQDQIKTGQALQGQYAQNPFNQQQLNAYANMGRTSQYANQLVPDLLGQLGGQSVGFDRNNTNGRVTPFSFNGAGGGAGGSGGSGGLLGMLSQSAMGAPTSAANPPPPPPAAPVAAPVSDAPGYGEFKYGNFPTEGSQAHKDMQTYFSQFGATGAADPYGIYGSRGSTTAQYGN